MSEAMTSEDDPSLSVCKTRDISPKQDGQVNGVVSSSDETRHTSGASTTQEPAKKPEIALYFLQASRSIRIAWLLEELGMEYKVVFYNREKSLAAPEEFKEVSGGTMGKAPVLKDGNLILEESGAITQYLLDKYDNLNYYLPTKPALRSKVLTYVHAAEATFLVHGLVPFYTHRASPDISPDLLQTLTIDTGHDLDWLDAQLKASGTRYLVGDTVTAADTMMVFSVQFILEFGLHPQENDGQWDNVRNWLGNVEKNKMYQRAVAKTGYTLSSKVEEEKVAV